jgi:hypothetical protein
MKEQEWGQKMGQASVQAWVLESGLL